MARRRKYSRALGLAQAGDVSPVWGVVASGVTGTGTAVALRATTSMDKHAELIGMGAGTLAGLALMMSKKTRAAGFTGIITALVNNGLRFLEASVVDKQKLKDLTGALASKTGTVKAQLEAAKSAAAAAGLGIVQANRMSLAGGGLGIVQPSVVPTLGAVSAEPMPTLGAVSAQRMPLAGFGAASASPVNIVGGLGSHYGATGIGGGID